MAFGRSNSLSLNTGATNSLFSQQSNTSQQPPTAPMFGASTSQPQQTGSLFGNTATSSAGQSGGLFGSSTATSQPAPSGGLFGGASTSNSMQQTGGGLFGNTGASTGGLFGSSTQQSQPQQSGGLFGGALGQSQNQNQTQNQGQQQTSSLFGNLGQSQGQGQNQNQGQQQTSSLFGGFGHPNPNQQNQTQQNLSQQNQGGGLFGNTGAQNKPTTSLFGGSTTQQPSAPQQQPMFGGSLFNRSTANPAPLAGSLTMGQQQQQQQTVPGAKVDLTNIRPTTRFSDLHDDIKKEIEAIDAFIKQQESYAAQCEALIPKHSTNLDSVTPDVELITGKLETVELALENDSRDINSAKELIKADLADAARCIRVIENLQLPSQFHYGPSVGAGNRRKAGDDDYDVDIVGYFTRQAESMQKTLGTFTANLGEIESHLRVIEASTIQRGQQLAAQKAGGTGGNNTVAELADTLRGFENGILNAAGFVGACREGVNELIVGKAGGEVRNRGGYRRY